MPKFSEKKDGRWNDFVIEGSKFPDVWRLVAQELGRQDFAEHTRVDQSSGIM